MPVETYEDLLALTPADALTLGFVGDSDAVRAERMETAERLLGQHVYDPAREAIEAGRVGFEHEGIVMAVEFAGGRTIGALHQLEHEAAQYEALPEYVRWTRRAPSLTVDQVNHLRSQMVAPMPPAAPHSQIERMAKDYHQIDTLRSQARHGEDPVGAARASSIAATSFENTYGFPPGESRPVIVVEQYLAAGTDASARAERVGMAAKAAHHAVEGAGTHFARVAEHEPPTSDRFQAAERSLERLKQIEDRINVTSYAGWGVDGLTLDREERALIDAQRVHRDRVERGIEVDTTPSEDRSLAYDEVGAVFDALAISRAAQGRVNIIEPVFGTDQEPVVRLEGPVPDVGMDEAQETVIVRRSSDGDLATDIESSGPGANDEATWYNVTDRAEIARSLGVDEPTAIATVAVAYGELERTRAHLENDMRTSVPPQQALGETPIAPAQVDHADELGAEAERQIPTYRDVLNHRLPLADIMRFGIEGNNPEQRMQRARNAQQVLDEYQEADTRAYENAAGSGSLEDPGLPRPAAADLVIAHDGDVEGAVHDPGFTDVVADHEGMTSGLEFVDDEDGFREEYVEREVEPAWVAQQRSAVLDGVPVQDGRDSWGRTNDQQTPALGGDANTVDVDDQETQSTVQAQVDHAEELVAEAASTAQGAAFAAAGTESPADDAVAADREGHVAQARDLVGRARVAGGAGVAAAQTAMRSAASVQRSTTRIWDDMAAQVEAQAHDRPASAAARLPRSADRTDYRPAATRYDGPSLGGLR